MANMLRYSPFDDLLKDFGQGYFLKPLAFPAEQEVKMKIDVTEDEKAYTIHAEIPGVRREDIKVDVEEDQVSLSAERKQEKEEKKGEKVVYSERSYGMASRSFSLPAHVDAKAAKAEYKDGVLSLVLPKRSNGSAKRIEIT